MATVKRWRWKLEVKTKSCRYGSPFSSDWSCRVLSVSIANSPSRDPSCISPELWEDAGLLLSGKKLCPFIRTVSDTYMSQMWIPSTLDSTQLKTVLADNSSAAKLCSSFYVEKMELVGKWGRGMGKIETHHFFVTLADLWLFHISELLKKKKKDVCCIIRKTTTTTIKLRQRCWKCFCVLSEARRSMPTIWVLEVNQADD